MPMTIREKLSKTVDDLRQLQRRIQPGSDADEFGAAVNSIEGVDIDAFRGDVDAPDPDLE